MRGEGREMRREGDRGKRRQRKIKTSWREQTLKSTSFSKIFEHKFRRLVTFPSTRNNPWSSKAVKRRGRREKKK